MTCGVRSVQHRVTHASLVKDLRLAAEEAREAVVKLQVSAARAMSTRLDELARDLRALRLVRGEDRPIVAPLQDARELPAEIVRVHHRLWASDRGFRRTTHDIHALASLWTVEMRCVAGDEASILECAHGRGEPLPDLVDGPPIDDGRLERIRRHDLLRLGEDLVDREGGSVDALPGLGRAQLHIDAV